MGKKKKLRKLMHRRGAEAPTLVVCVGKSCAPREASQALLGQIRAHAQGRVRVEVVGCLHVCEDGPVVATFPGIEFHRHVDGAAARSLIDELASVPTE